MSYKRIHRNIGPIHSY